MTGHLSRSSLRSSAALGTGVALAVLLAGAAHAQAPAPAPARTVVDAAVSKARAEKKVVLAEFGASWCVWCRSFDAFVHAPETSRIISNNFVVVNLTVQERDDKKALENPGGEALMTEWDGLDAGLPFYVFLKDGQKIADSNVMRDGSNVGFPGNDDELQVFMGLLGATAPRLSPADRAMLTAYLEKVVKP
jgi:thiol:disulfide interchange protein